MAISFWRELEFNFLKTLKTSPGPPLFATRVRRSASPINARKLAKRHKEIAQRMAIVQTKLAQRWGDILDEPDTTLPLSSLSARLNTRFAFEITEIDTPQQRFLWQPLEDCFLKLAAVELHLHPLLDFDVHADTGSNLYAHHQLLTHFEHFLDHEQDCLEVWSRELMQFGSGLLSSLPEGICWAERDANLALSGRLVDALDDPHAILAIILRQFVGVDGNDIREHELFSDLRDKLLRLILSASDMKPEDLAKKEPDTPLNHQDLPASKLVPKYFGGTAIAKLLLTKVPHEL